MKEKISKRLICFVVVVVVVVVVLSLFLRPVNQDGYIKARNDGQGNEERKQTNNNVHAIGPIR